MVKNRPCCAPHWMKDTLKSSWPLFLGIALIMVGNGLQGSLLGVRAAIENFSTPWIGVVMSCFYVGFLVGSSVTPRLLASVGHIRVFAAWASLASAAVLVHALWLEPAAWAAMRFFTGFAYAGMYVVAESWLNDRVDNSLRGQVLSLYMVVQYGGLAAGQFLLNVADTAGTHLFVLVSILVSLALIPISLSSRPAPLFESASPLPLRELFRITPTGLVGCVIAGATTGALLGMGPVYSQSAGFDVWETSMLMAAAITAGALLQFPLGRLSDRIWRTDVIIGVSIAAALVAAAVLLATPGQGMRVIGFVSLAALLLPLYALVLALANDRLRADQMVAAGSGLVLSFGVGAAFGPVAASAAIELGGPDGFFWVFVVLASLLALAGLTTRRRENQGKVDFLPTPLNSPHTPEERMDAEPPNQNEQPNGPRDSLR
ncbi:MAG: MFS family permease [Polyangiales bacterium]|jgi:MFS family permease